MKLNNLVTPLNTSELNETIVQPAEQAATFQDYYGFNMNPFSDSVNPSFFYKTSKHEEAFMKMMMSVENDISLGLVTGISGTGKTLLTQMLLYNLNSENYKPVLVLAWPGMTKTVLLREILMELDPEFNEKVRQTGDLLKLLHAHIIDLYKQHKKLVILIDEAHFLCSDSLHILRTISNLETPEKKLITCLLFSEDRLLRRLSHPSYESLRSRTYMKAALEALNEKEVQQYIKFLLLVAGGSDDQFASETFSMICQASKGICRMVNKICNNCLIEAFVLGKKHVDTTIVQKVIAEIK